MYLNLSEGVNLDAQQVITGRCCVIGQSGSGKSFLIGVLIEEMCKAKLPFIVIDTEGEYRNLKSIFNALWVSEDPSSDVKHDIDYQRLASQSISSGIPIIFDVSDLTDKSKPVFDMLQALYSIEERLKSPYLVIVEEADKFAPQMMHKGVNMIEEISVRGRKRGIGLVVATQRPANISKNVLAQCSYGFIGKLTIENDLSAVSTLFENRKKLEAITKLPAGNFMPFGINEDNPFKVKQRMVSHMGDTPGLAGMHDVKTDISDVIKNLSKNPEHKDEEGVSRKQKASKLFVIKGNYDVEQAKSFALKLYNNPINKMRLNRENVESVEKAYLPMLNVQIIQPTKNASTFKEFYSLLSPDGKIIQIKKSIVFIDPGISKSIPISQPEQDVSRALMIYGGLDIKKLSARLGFSQNKLSVMLLSLERRGIIKKSKDKYVINTFLRYASRKPVECIEEKSAGILPYANVSQQKLIKYARLIFPGCSVSPVALVHLPIYKIVLRSSNRIKVIMLDAIGFKDQSRYVNPIKA